MFRSVLSVFCVGVLLLVAVSTANAQDMIGVKYFSSNGLLPTDNVGAPGYAQANWTIAPNQGQGPPLIGPLADLKDENGVATLVTVTRWYCSGNSWSDGPPATT